MRAIGFLCVLVIGSGGAGCTPLLDESELEYSFQLEAGFETGIHHRPYQDELVEGRGALAGSMPHIVVLENVELKSGDRLRIDAHRPFEPDAAIDCSTPEEAAEGELCRSASDRSMCCVGPFMGSDGTRAAAMVRVGVYPNIGAERGELDIELMRAGVAVGRGHESIYFLPELLLGTDALCTSGGAGCTLDDLGEFRVDGDEPYPVFSRIEAAGDVLIENGDEIVGPARLVSTTSIALRRPLDFVVEAGAGGEAPASTPALAGFVKGALGLFADELIIGWDAHDESVHIRADAVVMRGRLRGEPPEAESAEVHVCLNFLGYEPSCPSPDRPFVERFRFDVPSICVHDDVGPTCDGVFFDDDFLEVGEVARIGPTLSVGGGRYVVVGSEQLEELVITLRGRGMYRLVAGERSQVELGTVDLGAGEVSAGQYIESAAIDPPIGPGRNQICALADLADPAVDAAEIERASCVEVVYLP